MINFVSNLPADLRSGGFSAMNAAALDVVAKRDTVSYVGPVNPPALAWQKALSKLRRVSGLPGNFFQYSERRLARIACEVDARSAPKAQFDFFHGFTPWVLTRPRRPYLAWSDCTFRDYIDIYHRRGDFCADDLQRIEQTEATWMKGARRIAFTSVWAAERAAQAYNLSRERIDVVGIFGESVMPDQDVYAGAKQFTFVSTNFEAKGGRVVLSAFQRVRESDPDATLIIVGEHPPSAKSAPGVIATGFLHKEDPRENARFRGILATSRALLHPTQSDIAPLVVVEAGYFGCPAISSCRFAIPELVDHGRTGILLDDPGDASIVADSMMAMLSSDTRYRAMREAAWIRSRKAHSKAAFERRFHAFLEAGDISLTSADGRIGTPPHWGRAAARA
ncbi:MAG TPA: glycosyltransferase family 4 protein [Terracidiphilus sp.]|nr:glycosyltransferase family 4 protein [Terracidiphilus sp.]